MTSCPALGSRTNLQMLRCDGRTSTGCSRTCSGEGNKESLALAEGVTRGHSTHTKHPCWDGPPWEELPKTDLPGNRDKDENTALFPDLLHGVLSKGIWQQGYPFGPASKHQQLLSPYRSPLSSFLVLLNLMALSNKSFWNISPWIWSHHRPQVSAAHEQLLHPGLSAGGALRGTPSMGLQQSTSSSSKSLECPRERLGKQQGPPGSGKAAGTSLGWEST